jgi:hypothetical protein
MVHTSDNVSQASNNALIFVLCIFLEAARVAPHRKTMREHVREKRFCRMEEFPFPAKNTSGMDTKRRKLHFQL